jgi:hypothetical protein
MRPIVSALGFISISAVLAGSAAAQPAATKPAFALMDSTGDDSNLTLDLAVLVPTLSELRGVVAVRSSITGQYVAPNGFGDYASLGTSSMITKRGAETESIGSRTFDLSNFGLGSAELGGLFHRALSSNLDLGVRVGFVHPTGREGGASLHELSTLLARPADLVTAIPDTYWLRLGISPTYHQGSLFVGADLGVDVAVHTSTAAGAGGGGGEGDEGDEAGEVQKGDAIEHLNIGAGIQRNRFIATAEVQAAFAKSEGDIVSISTAGLSARYQSRALSPFVLVSTPIAVAAGSSGIVLAGKVVTVTGGVTFGF